jgi:predicted MFS family arabinose efflux permease
MRRLLLLVSAIVLVETVFFSALAPLLPYYEDEVGLSKQAAGVLTAIYAAGALAGAIPGGALAARFGVKPAVILGLGVMIVASVAFGFADSVWTLNAARFGQGVGSALAWTGGLAWLIAVAPRDRRGELIGIAIGSAVAGALLGPVLGWVATEIGTAWAFGAVAVLDFGLLAWAWLTPASSPQAPQRLREVRRALREPAVLRGFWFVTLAAFLLGVISVLGPLRLDELGWSAFAISLAFFISAGVEAVLAPLQGRWSDRRGAWDPVRVGLVCSIALSLALAIVDAPRPFIVLVVLAAIAYGFFWVPGTALLSDGTERAALDLAFAAMLLNLAWAPGNVVGAAAGGALADAAGDGVVYLVVIGLCAVTLLASLRSDLGPRRRRVERADSASRASSAPAD